MTTPLTTPLTAPPDGPRPAPDTVTVFGGAGVTAVESDSVRRAAARVAAAGDDLRSAARLCLAASEDVVLPGVAEATSRQADDGLGPLGAALAPAARALEAAVHDVARSLVQHADLCDLLGWRLLRAAGLYEEAESTAERVVGALVTAGTFGTGAAFGSQGGLGLAGAGVLAAGDLAGRVGGGLVTGGASWAVSGWLGSAAVRALAPYSDEVFAGLGSGVGQAQPGLAGGHPGIAGGAGVLAHVARELPLLGNDDPGIRVTRITGEDFADGSPPAWSGTGARSVQEAVARIDSLYPATGGAPPGTVAVQKVTGSRRRRLVDRADPRHPVGDTCGTPLGRPDRRRARSPAGRTAPPPQSSVRSPTPASDPTSR